MVIKYEYILGRSTVWNVKHACLSDIEERRRAVIVFGEVLQTCVSTLRYDEKYRIQDRWVFFVTAKKQLGK